jgi:hypothetical protein
MLWYFMEIFIVAAWEIWKQRNDKIFKAATPSFQSWKRCFIATTKLQLYRLKEGDRQCTELDR